MNPVQRRKIILFIIIVCVVGLAYSIVIYNKKIMENTINKQTLLVESSAFINDVMIPVKFTCDGENINPPLTVSNIPRNASMLAIIVEDHDAPNGIFYHWVKWNIPVSGSTFEIKEGVEPLGVSGSGSSGSLNYSSPCPPSGTHRYIFNIYALDNVIDLKESATAQELIETMKNHIVAEGQLIGLYQSKSNNRRQERYNH